MDTFSFGVPTYNRSECILQLLQSASTQEHKNDIPILVFDNASDSEHISSLNSAVNSFKFNRLVFRTFDENLGFHGNLFRLISNCETEWLIICSDEDTPLLDKVYEVDPSLFSGYSAVVFSFLPIPQEPRGMKRLFATQRDASIRDIVFDSRYISGIAFRVADLGESVKLCQQSCKSNKYALFYPHLYLLICAQLLGKKVSISPIATVERREMAQNSTNLWLDESKRLQVGGLESRFSQWKGLMSVFDEIKGAFPGEVSTSSNEFINGRRLAENCLYEWILAAISYENRTWADLFVSGAQFHSLNNKHMTQAN